MQSNLFPMNKKGDIGRAERLKQRKKERKMEIDKQKEIKNQAGIREKEEDKERMRMRGTEKQGAKELDMCVKKKARNRERR